jgi:ferritin-like metal-binding protein YciE
MKSTKSTEKIIQYLNEARAAEQALTRTLQAHIAMTPSGPYRSDLERHLRETGSHAERLARRLRELAALHHHPDCRLHGQPWPGQGRQP